LRYFTGSSDLPTRVPAPAAATAQPLPTTDQKAFSLERLVNMTPEELAGVDIAETNLLCATGLKGADGLDVGRCLLRLDEYAQWVRHYTEQSLWDFLRRPHDFKNSEARFRVLLLISVLQKEYGVHYNEQGERTCDFSNSKNPFIHGMIDDANGGTCASMPVMYVAVGRRLGYPMKLVLAKTHVFARWDNPKTGEQFNVEGTNARFDAHPDSYYRNWPYPISDEEVQQGWYLKSLTPSEELAVFLQNRAHCLIDSGRFSEARAAFVHSFRLAPHNPLGRVQIASVTRPRGLGRAVSTQYSIPGRAFVDEFSAPAVNPDPLADIEKINAMTRANLGWVVPDETRPHRVQPSEPAIAP